MFLDGQNKVGGVQLRALQHVRRSRGSPRGDLTLIKMVTSWLPLGNVGPRRRQVSGALVGAAGGSVGCCCELPRAPAGIPPISRAPTHPTLASAGSPVWLVAPCRVMAWFLHGCGSAGAQCRLCLCREERIQAFAALQVRNVCLPRCSQDASKDINAHQNNQLGCP